MLPFSVTIPAAVPQRSEIPEGLTNYPVYTDDSEEHMYQTTWHCMSVDFLVNIDSSEKLKALSVIFLITVICPKHVCGK